MSVEVKPKGYVYCKYYDENGKQFNLYIGKYSKDGAFIPYTKNLNSIVDYFLRQSFRSYSVAKSLELGQIPHDNKKINEKEFEEWKKKRQRTPVASSDKITTKIPKKWRSMTFTALDLLEISSDWISKEVLMLKLDLTKDELKEIVVGLVENNLLEYDEKRNQFRTTHKGHEFAKITRKVSTPDLESTQESSPLSSSNHTSELQTPKHISGAVRFETGQEEKSGRWQCERCGNTFASFEELRSHKKKSTHNKPNRRPRYIKATISGMDAAELKRRGLINPDGTLNLQGAIVLNPKVRPLVMISPPDKNVPSISSQGTKKQNENEQSD